MSRKKHLKSHVPPFKKDGEQKRSVFSHENTKQTIPLPFNFISFDFTPTFDSLLSCLFRRKEQHRGYVLPFVVLGVAEIVFSMLNVAQFKLFFADAVVTWAVKKTLVGCLM